MASVPVEARAAFARIVVATDGSAPSQRAVEWAREIAALDATSRRVFVVHAIAPGREADPFVLESAGRIMGDRAQAEPLLAFGVDAARSIARLAADVQADLVIVGSHGRGAIGRIVLGSVSDEVKDLVATSIIIARTTPPPRRVLLADDGVHSARAGPVATGLARAWGAPLSVLRSESGDAARVGAQVVEYARSTGAGLVVLGSRARRLPGVGSYVARHAAASVLIVKG